METKLCPDCNGSGTVVGVTSGCCGHPNPDGSCCGIPIPEPIQEQCLMCGATGYVTVVSPSEDKTAEPKIQEVLNDVFIKHKMDNKIKPITKQEPEKTSKNIFFCGDEPRDGSLDMESITDSMRKKKASSNATPVIPEKEDTKIHKSERDWVEDFTHENGNYLNTCCLCHLYFYGHKRRVVCKVCDLKAAPVIEQKEEDIIKFLLGEGSFCGLWFGEENPRSTGGKFWWRTFLRAYAESKQLTPKLDASQFNSGDRVNHFLVNAMRQLTTDEMRILAEALLDRLPKPPKS